RAERVRAVAEGECLVGVGWQPGVAASAEGDDVVLDGTSRFLGVGGADAYVIAAQAGQDTMLCWLEADAAGVTDAGERGVDGTASACLTMRRAPARVLIGPDRGAEVLEAALDVARVAVSAELVGVMDTALELTLDYLRNRKQFGRPIGSFQALQHRAVDAWMQRELASAALDAAVRVHLDPRADARERAAAASS